MTAFVQARAAAWTRRAPAASAFAVALTACLATVAAVAVALLSVPVGTRSIAVPVFVVGATAVFGFGLSDLARAHERRFALALILAGFLWSLSALSASTEPALYSIGRVNQWLAHLAIIYLLLSYPSGRLTERTARVLFAGGALLTGLLYLPTALVVQAYPDRGLWSACSASCPHNAFALVHSTPTLVGNLVIPVREVLAVGLFVAVAVFVARRRQQPGPLQGPMYAPVAWLAVFVAVGLGVYFPIRAAAPDSWSLVALSWIFLLALPGLALAGVVGRLYRRVYAANALDRIARSVGASGSAPHVRRALADALHDPSLWIFRSLPGESRDWIDESGAPVTLPAEGSGHEVTEVASDDGGRIAIVHDPALSEDRALVQTAGSYALTALENHHLSGQLRTSIEELAKARARGIAAEDRERRKIERDLHDGAQQRLVAVRLKLGLAAGQLADRDPIGAAVIRALGQDIDATIDDVRAFARGIYPPLLAQTGLPEALRSIARIAALPTTVNAERLERYAPEVETAVYFACSEALQNAAKHARGATGVTISVWQDQELHFEIIDDGAGFDVASTACGTGLTNLQDRLATIAGTITIESSPGRGTTVSGSIPLT